MMINWVSKWTDTTNGINITVGEIIFNRICVKNQNPSAKFVSHSGHLCST